MDNQFVYCGRCGAANYGGSQYCMGCGAPLAPNGGKSKGAVPVWLGILIAVIALIVSFGIAFLCTRLITRVVDKSKEETVVEEVDSETDEQVEGQAVAQTESQPGSAITETAEPAEEAPVWEGASESNQIDKEYYQIPIQSVDASSTLKASSVDGATYWPSNTIDGELATAWVEGVDGDGIYEGLTYYFDGYHDVKKVLVYSGYLKTKYRYTINGKPTKVSIDFCNGTYYELDLNVMYPGMDDVPFATGDYKPAELYLDRPINTDRIIVTIMDAETGTKYADTAISEVTILGTR